MTASFSTYYPDRSFPHVLVYSMFLTVMSLAGVALLSSKVVH